MIRKIGICIGLLLLFNSTVIAQQVLWDVDFVGFFDNREYKIEQQQAQTFFGTRLSPEIGLGLDNNRHRLMVGVSWIQPLGTKVDESTLFITTYYRYTTPRFKMSVGSFPRTQLIEAVPQHLLYDSLTYFRPNLTGALFQYEAPKGYAELYIDWRRMQTTSEREAFLVHANGRYQPNMLFLGGHLMMNHLARPKNSPATISVMDDIVANPYLGIDLTSKVPLDSLSLKCGYQLGLQRHRGEGKWIAPQGVLVEFYIQWRFLGLKDTFYAGGNQMPFYSRPDIGALLNQGDPFYQTRLYNRTDLFCYLFRNSFVNCFVSLNLHYAEKEINFQQQLVVRLNIDNEVWKNKRASQKGLPKLRNIFD